jgi:hypothetical protein
MATYSDLLKNPRWQRTRLGILDRDNWQCAYCGREDKTLHVHHHFYGPKGSMPWDIPDFALITLCEDCHTKEEQIKELDEDLLREFFLIGMTRQDIHDLADALSYYANDQVTIVAVRAKLKAFIRKLKEDNYNNSIDPQ